MPNPISSTSSGSAELDYTPVDGYEDAEAGVCKAPTATETEAESEPPHTSYRTTYGDGKIHREGFGLRVDPNVSKRMEVKGEHADHTVVASGVDAFVGATTHNADGSTGARVGASASLEQVTWTGGDKRGDEITIGAAAGVGFDVSSGTRDVDKDGRKEYCLRAAIGPVIAGACAEYESIAEDAKEFYRRLSQ
jgi:hypothetical protein